MRYAITIACFLLSFSTLAQNTQSGVEFADYKRQVLLVKKDAMKATGKLNSGELIGAGCDQGSCFFEIGYKGRKVRQNVGQDITRLTIYEFDFNADGDLELIAVNEFKGKAYLYIFSYSKGIILKLFEKEIRSDKVIIKKDYIEYYLQGDLDLVWHYYQGNFWKMVPYEN